MFGALLVSAVVVAACGPITPTVEYSRSSFEGFPVTSYVPEHPRGIAYLFHGSNGSAAFADKTETVAVTNLLVGQGYGFVVTESTERTGARRWNVRDPSPTTNPDLARLARLHDRLVATTALDATTPIVGVGMSNGARFVTLWGQTWRQAGYPVRAIWASMGTIAAPVVAAGGLTVPTAFSIAEHDFTIDNRAVARDFAATRRRGTPAELFESYERPLRPEQYLRVDGIDRAEAEAVVAAFRATGVWDASGARVVADPAAAVAQATRVVLPASVAPQRAGIEDETAVLMAVHQFSAEHADRVAAFFARFVPA